jgi:hypothetical protein
VAGKDFLPPYFCLRRNVVSSLFHPIRIAEATVMRADIPSIPYTGVEWCSATSKQYGHPKVSGGLGEGSQEIKKRLF